jgi:hypothetical protein
MFKNATATACEIERLCSKYKDVSNDARTLFSPNDLTVFLIVQIVFNICEDNQSVWYKKEFYQRGFKCVLPEQK